LRDKCNCALCIQYMHILFYGCKLQQHNALAQHIPSSTACGRGGCWWRPPRGWHAGPSTRSPTEQVLEPVHQPRLEPAPARVHVPGDGGCEVLTVPEPAAQDAEADRLVEQAVDHGGGVLLLRAVEAGVK
jgi:hypothetical protein